MPRHLHAPAGNDHTALDRLFSLYRYANEDSSPYYFYSQPAHSLTEF